MFNILLNILFADFDHIRGLFHKTFLTISNSCIYILHVSERVKRDCASCVSVLDVKYTDSISERGIMLEISFGILGSLGIIMYDDKVVPYL